VVAERPCGHAQLARLRCGRPPVGTHLITIAHPARPRSSWPSRTSAVARHHHPVTAGATTEKSALTLPAGWSPREAVGSQQPVYGAKLRATMVATQTHSYRPYDHSSRRAHRVSIVRD
jgi:hypothetical protein